VSASPITSARFQWLDVARHELRIAFATRRAWVVASFYVLIAVLGAAAYAGSVHAIERHTVGMLTERGVDARRAEKAVSSGAQHTIAELAAKLAGAEGAQIAPSLTASPLPPAFLWGALGVFPFLVLLTSFDIVAADLQARSLCYAVLRTSRRSLLVGKLCAQSVLFLAVNLIAIAAMVSAVAMAVDDFELTAAAPGLLRSWVLLIPYCFCYLGLATACSTRIAHPTLALLTALGVMLALRLVGLVAHVPDRLAALRPLQWLSPSSYAAGFWEAGVSAPLVSSVAYLAFGSAFLAAALRTLERRDL
jgi:ABC-type transport system involved in multi-copper enzyme maturation permease subunit